MRKKVRYILELLDTEEQGTEFCFRMLTFITIYKAYSEKISIQVLYKHFRGGGGFEAMLICLF